MRSRILDKRLAPRAYVLGPEPTIADLSLVGYLYYPPEEFGFDMAAEYKNIGAWLDAHQGPARLGASLRSDARLSAAAMIRRGGRSERITPAQKFLEPKRSCATRA